GAIHNRHPQTCQASELARAQMTEPEAEFAGNAAIGADRRPAAGICGAAIPQTPATSAAARARRDRSLIFPGRSPAFHVERGAGDRALPPREIVALFFS